MTRIQAGIESVSRARPRRASSFWGAALALVVVAAGSPAAAWNDPVHERIASLSTKLMPPYFAAQIARQQEALLAGLHEPDRQSAAQSHQLLVGSGEGTLDGEVAAAVARAIHLLRTRGTFADVARELGRISHLAADAAFPLNTSASDPRASAYYADYTAYASLKLNRFPAVFDGYVRFENGFDPAAYVRQIADQANRSVPVVAAGYFPPGGGAMLSSRVFDDRGPVFGVTQLSFVHAVTASANLWLYVWREAHGDIQNTPHYPAARNTGAANRAGAAQRP